MLSQPRRFWPGEQESRQKLAALQNFVLAQGGDELEAGWYATTKTRLQGDTEGQVDAYYYTPSGGRLRSRLEVARWLGLDVADVRPSPVPQKRSTSVTAHLTITDGMARLQLRLVGCKRPRGRPPASTQQPKRQKTGGAVRVHLKVDGNAVQLRLATGCKRGRPKGLLHPGWRGIEARLFVEAGGTVALQLACVAPRAPLSLVGKRTAGAAAAKAAAAIGAKEDAPSEDEEDEEESRGLLIPYQKRPLKKLRIPVPAAVDEKEVRTFEFRCNAVDCGVLNRGKVSATSRESILVDTACGRCRTPLKVRVHPPGLLALPAPPPMAPTPHPTAAEAGAATDAPIEGDEQQQHQQHQHHHQQQQQQQQQQPQQPASEPTSVGELRAELEESRRKGAELEKLVSKLAQEVRQAKLSPAADPGPPHAPPVVAAPVAPPVMAHFEPPSALPGEQPAAPPAVPRAAPPAAVPAPPIATAAVPQAAPPAASVAAAAQPLLVLMPRTASGLAGGADATRVEVRLLPHGEVTLGRDPGARSGSTRPRWGVRHPMVSSRHARLRAEPPGVLHVQALGLNPLKVLRLGHSARLLRRGEEEAKLRAGDELHLLDLDGGGVSSEADAAIYVVTTPLSPEERPAPPPAPAPTTAAPPPPSRGAAATGAAARTPAAMTPTPQDQARPAPAAAAASLLRGSTVLTPAQHAPQVQAQASAAEPGKAAADAMPAPPPATTLTLTGASTSATKAADPISAHETNNPSTVSPRPLPTAPSAAVTPGTTNRCALKRSLPVKTGEDGGVEEPQPAKRPRQVAKPEDPGYQIFLDKYTKQYHIAKTKNSDIKWQPEEAWRQLGDDRRARWQAKAERKKQAA